MADSQGWREGPQVRGPSLASHGEAPALRRAAQAVGLLSELGALLPLRMFRRRSLLPSPGPDPAGTSEADPAAAAVAVTAITVPLCQWQPRAWAAPDSESISDASGPAGRHSAGGWAAPPWDARCIIMMCSAGACQFSFESEFDVQEHAPFYCCLHSSVLPGAAAGIAGLPAPRPPPPPP